MQKDIDLKSFVYADISLCIYLSQLRNPLSPALNLGLKVKAVIFHPRTVFSFGCPVLVYCF